MPFDPDVLMTDSKLSRLRTSRSQTATWQHSITPAGGPGSRSNTTEVGLSMFSALASEGCNSMDARLATHTNEGRSSSRQNCTSRRRSLTHIGAVWTQSGRWDGQFFSQNDWPSTPLG